MSTLLRVPAEVVGAGRTDSGVHAAFYVAHFDVFNDVDAVDPQFCYHLNSLLPPDIAVRTIRPVRSGAHARFDAVEREYTYYIKTEKDPFTRETAWFCGYSLDIGAMNRAAAMLVGRAEFTTFSKLHSNNKTDICDVRKSLWNKENNTITYTIASDRFLRNMVRSVVGNLVDVGRGKITPEQFGEIFRSCDRSRAGGSAPAEGLFLSGVRYPKEIFETDENTGPGGI